MTYLVHLQLSKTITTKSKRIVNSFAFCRIKYFHNISMISIDSVKQCSQKPSISEWD